MTIVFQNIEETIYFFEIYEMKFYFSSFFNKKRFINKYQSFIEIEEKKIVNKYHYSIDIKKYLLIALYLKIEHRGFLVEVNGEKLKYNDFNFITNVYKFKESW